MIRGIRSSILMSLPLLCIVIVNFIIDPANLVTNDYYVMATSILKSDIGVVQLGNLDERNLKKELLKNTKNVDNIVLGSSRSMQIREHNVEGTLMNASVSGASLEDYIALYQVYMESHVQKPKRLIIGVDPWIFNNNHNQTRWLTIEADYIKGIENISNKSINFKNFNMKKFIDTFIPITKQQLLSLSYFQASIEELKENNFKIENKKKMNVLYATAKDSDEGYIICNDGSLIYESSFKYGENDSTSNYAYSINDFNQLSTEYKESFELFIKSVKNTGIEVILYLPPYNPDYIERLKADTDENYYWIIAEVEDYLLKFANDEYITLIGGYYSDMSKEDFYDGLHIKTKGIEKLFTRVQNF